MRIIVSVQACVVILLSVGGQGSLAAQSTPNLAQQSAAESQPPAIQSITLPDGYREWKLLSVAHEAGALNDLRAILGNDIAYEAARKGIVPFPDGAAIARLAWVYTSSERNNKSFGKNQSFVAGEPTNVQLLVKNSGKFSSTGGWGFAQFSKGNPANEAMTKDCFSCHSSVKTSDYVFTRYAP